MSSFERLQHSRIGTLALIGAGGQAKVYRAPEVVLADESRPLVYKEYKNKRISITGLDNAIAFRLRLSDHERMILDRIANWPLRVVEGAGGRAEGVILPLLEPEYFHEILMPKGKVLRAPRDGQYLAQPKERCDRYGVSLAGTGDRYRFCRDLAFAMGFLHKREICLGDISFSNAVYSLEHDPCAYLVDCDAARRTGTAPVVPQLHTPDWDPPEGTRVQTRATDRYKIGLFILRALSPRAVSGQNRDPAWADPLLGPRGRVLLRKALSRDPAERPEVKDWYVHFREVLRTQRLRTTPSQSRMPPRAAVPGA